MIKVIHWVDVDGESYIIKVGGRVVKRYTPREFIQMIAQPHTAEYRIESFEEEEIIDWDHYDGFVYLASGSYKSCDEDALETFNKLWEVYVC